MDAVVQRAPDDAEMTRSAGRALRQAAGMLVRRVRTEPEADPPRACIAFTSAPSRRADFHAAGLGAPRAAGAGRGGHARGRPDLRLRPALGATTRITAARRDAGRGRAQPAQGHRGRRSRWPTAGRASSSTRRLFVLPRGQAPAVDADHGQSLRGDAEAGPPDRAQRRRPSCATRSSARRRPLERRTIAEETGRVVWKGSADIPQWQPNQPPTPRCRCPTRYRTPGPASTR